MSCSMAPDVLQEPPTVEPPPRPVRLADLDRCTPAEEPESVRWLRQLDLAVVGLGVLLRALFYGAVYAVATRWDFGPSMLGGMLAGDMVGSVGTLAWDWRRRGIVSVVELLLVAAFATWWWTREDGALAHPEYQAVLVLAGFGAFTARTSVQATRAFGANDDLV